MHESLTMGELMILIPKLPQRQDSLGQQIYDLILVANKLGMYDAADFITKAYLKD